MMARPRLVETEEILRVARECYLEHGTALPTQVIAERLGVSQAALFKRFGTKEELMIAALAPRPAEWLGVLNDPLRAEDAPRQIARAITEMLAFMRRNTPALNMLRCSGLPANRLLQAAGDTPPPVQAMRALAAWIQAGMDAGVLRKGDPRYLALMVMGAVNGRVFLGQVLRQPELLGDDAEFISTLVDALWRGVRAEVA
jgi:AcrR family transcriptional regulator